MKRNMKRVGWAGASAALALAATGFIAPTAAFAGDAESTAPTSGPQYDANAKAVMSSDDDVKLVGSDGKGNVLVFTTADEVSLEVEARQFVENNANVILKKLDAAPQKAASTDIVGGAGYLGLLSDGSGGRCSIGFPGFSPDGDPAVISAGHCTEDGLLKNTFMTKPSSDPAGGGSQSEPTFPLGVYGFSQFGGPGNTPGSEGGSDSVDISVIDVTNEDLDLKPEVTDWTTVSDLSLSTKPIRSVGTAQLGTYEKSGSTTGYSQGTVEVIDGWLQVDGRWVHGFGGPMTVNPGDSGGSIWQGDTAVGVMSALLDVDGVRWAWGADLQSGLALTGGYTVEVLVDAPKLTTEDGSTVTTGSNISGTAQANTKLVVTPEKGDAFTIDVDGSGNWSFAAPETLGAYAFSLQSTSGFSKSSTVDASVNVVPQAPVITSPADGASIVNKITKVTGTGLAGATVTLTGDVTGTATVNAEGNWVVAAEREAGAYKVTATQARDGVTSASASTSFTVVPNAPTIDGIVDGSSYSDSAIPTKVSGSGETGADITVSLNGAEVGKTTVKSGKWTVAFADALAPGDYTVVATQTVNGQSNNASVSFSVAAAPGPSPSPSPSTPSTPGPTPGPQGTLPKTGASDPAPLALGAAALLLGGLGAVGYRRFRRVSR